MTCTWSISLEFWQTNWILHVAQKASKFQNQIHKVQNLSLTSCELILLPTYSSQQSGCISSFFSCFKKKRDLTQSSFPFKVVMQEAHHHRLVDDQLIDPSTMRVLKRHRKGGHLGGPPF